MNSLEYINEKEKDIKNILEDIDNIVLYNSKKVLDAFQKENVSESFVEGLCPTGADEAAGWKWRGWNE